MSDDRVSRLSGRILHETFVVDEIIGEGGMGVVYAAHNAKTPGIRYAIKVMRTEKRTSAEIDAQRFRREAHALAALDHPAIVRPIHVDVTAEGEPYLVMEFVRGTSLRDKIIASAREGGQLPLPFIIAVLDGVADALDHAHGRGIVHRDLKPENVMVVDGGRSVLVKVFDFGIAKIFHPDGKPADDLTRTSEVAGTVSYMSPEQCRDLKTAGAASDRFTLAVMAYELIAGARPFDGTNASSTICNILLNPLVALSTVRRDLNERVDAVFERGCSKEPSLRYPTASEFVAALADAIGVGSITSLAPAVRGTLLSDGSAETQRAAAWAATMVASAPVEPTVTSSAIAKLQRVPPLTSDRGVRESDPGPDDDSNDATLDTDAPGRDSFRQDRSDDGGGSRSLDPGRKRSSGLSLGAVVTIVGLTAAGTAAAVIATRRPVTPIPPPPGPPAAVVTCAGRIREPTHGLYDDEACIPAGALMMGSPVGSGDYDEQPRHRVTVRAFYIDLYEVSVGRYRRCVTGGGCDATGLGTEGPYDEAGNYAARGTRFRASPRCAYRDQPSTNDTRPVNCISYAQAVQVCRFEGRRLLSEAEWERAARGAGDSPRTFPWGEDAADCNRASFGYGSGCGLAEVAPVGTARSGATPEGVFDLAGNVSEWTADWYSDRYYAHSPAVDPPGTTPDEAREHGGDPAICRDGCRVTRGGGWNTAMGLATFLRGAHRTADAPSRRAVHLGVRCGRTP